MEYSGVKLRSLISSLLFFFSVFVIIDVSVDLIENASGDILYVNTTGDGGAFTSIQDAINASSDGDTVFVYRGTYYEKLNINTSINLIGEDREGTIINGSNSRDIITVNVNLTNISCITIIGNGFPFRYAGIKFNYVNNCSVYSCNISCTKNGIELHYSKDICIRGNDLSNQNWDLHLKNTFDNIIEMNNINRGIYLYNAWKNTIARNNIVNGFIGIFVYRSFDNRLGNNTLGNNENGISIDFSERIYLSNNTLSHNERGIEIDHSQECKLEFNVMMEDGITMSGTKLEHWNTHDIDSSNIVNGKPVYYIKNQTNITVPSGFGQIILANSSNCIILNYNFSNVVTPITLGYSFHNKIINNNLSNNEVGISLMRSDHNYVAENEMYNSYHGCILGGDFNTFYNNNVLNNSYGIRLQRHNTIIGNNISRNYAGIVSLGGYNNTIIQNNISYNNHSIYLHDANENHIYNNNFINNYDYVIDHYWSYWDDGYPIGGNYWSDYKGNDSYKGPNQDQEGGDGIGDNPYEVYFGHWDHYPLMEPYTYKSLENFTILRQGWNLISIPLIQQNSDLQKVLEMIDSYYDAVQWYNHTDNNDPWKHHKIGKPFGNDLFELNETMGFWIYITNPGDTIFLYNGTQPSENQTIPLKEGWNLVGYPSLTNYNRTEGLNNLTIGKEVEAIWTYDAPSQKWIEMCEIDFFDSGNGYYIHAKNECVWEVPL